MSGDREAAAKAAAKAALEAAKAEKRRDARRLPLELGGGRYTKWRNRVVDTERHVLKELGFGFYQMMEHPHKFLLYYIKYLASKGLHLSGVEESSSSSSSSPSASSASSERRETALAQHAWAYLNDSSRLDLCVRFDTRHVACAAILMASRRPEVRLPLPAPRQKSFHPVAT